MAKSSKRRPRFITFEGTEGAGKSTLIRGLSQWLNDQRIPHIVTREPGGTALSESIRELLLNKAMNPWTELFLYEAARAEHLQSTILPALKRWDWVLCDRYTDSTLAYQGAARGLPIAEIRKLNDLATQKTAPDLTVWVDVNPALGLSRATNPNRFENEGVAFQSKVRQGFERARRLRPKAWMKLQSDKSSSHDLMDQLIQEVKKRFKLP